MGYQILVFLLIALLIAGLIAIGIKEHKEKKSKFLRLLGYDYVYYYMKHCNDINYYKTPTQHIHKLYYPNRDQLITNKDQWFVTEKSKVQIEAMINFYEKAAAFSTIIAPFFSRKHYFTYSEHSKYLSRASELEKMMEQIVNGEFKSYIAEKYHDQEFQKYPRYKSYDHQIPALREEHNKEFIKAELTEHKRYFDTLLDYPLDQQQREAIVKLEDNCLVISSAGSGKTSTSIAKVRYLLEKQYIKKEKILVLSYNRKTADEFEERLNVKGLTCKTFHALAMAIIAEVEKKRPDICDATFLITCYYKLVNNNEKYKADINKFFGELASLTKLEHQYEKAEDYYNDRETYGIMAPYGDMNSHPVYTRSEEEKKICTWLTTHGIKFLYEAPYPISTANTEHRQYRPDFTIYYEKNGKTNYIFLEHFGIDAHGNVPKWFGQGKKGGFYTANSKYNDDIKWKRRLHKNNGTALIETTSAMFHNGTIYRQLETQLRLYGINPREISEEEKYDRLVRRSKTMEDNIKTLFSSFINLMKSNGKTFDSIMNSIKYGHNDALAQYFNHKALDAPKEDFVERSRFLIYNLIKPLYEEYQNSLKAKKQMDFTDLILTATDLCNSGKYKTPYSYIVVDEFQDISVDRYKFIVALRQKDPRTKTFCVGDDWQSIYRFSGSDMNLFNNFSQYFGFTEECKIETTYRFGDPLVYRSSRFILKNPAQVKKQVRPFSTKKSTNISFIPFNRSSKQEYLKTITNILNKIPSKESVMLLGRYNYEVDVFPANCVEKDPNSKRAKVTFGGRTMNFMSIHAAKGLEADNVLILNCSQDSGGFPSRVTDDPILGYVLSKIDDFEYSEERRLFYVAITRAKKHTYVLYNEMMPSVFVTEMIDEDEDQNEQVLCPTCKKGKIKVLKVARSARRTCYCNLKCSNSIANCMYFETIFFNSPDDFTPKYRILLDKYARQFEVKSIEEYIETYWPAPPVNLDDFDFDDDDFEF